MSLRAAVEALQKVMPPKAEAMTQEELFEKAGVITATTGQRALKQLLAEDEVDALGRASIAIRSGISWDKAQCFEAGMQVAGERASPPSEVYRRIARYALEGFCGNWDF